MRPISVKVYRRLLQQSIEFQKTQKTITNLKHSLFEKLTIIRDLQKKVSLFEKNKEKSKVNVMPYTININIIF